MPLGLAVEALLRWVERRQHLRLLHFCNGAIQFHTDLLDHRRHPHDLLHRAHVPMAQPDTQRHAPTFANARAQTQMRTHADADIHTNVPVCALVAHGESAHKALPDGEGELNGRNCRRVCAAMRVDVCGGMSVVRRAPTQRWNALIDDRAKGTSLPRQA